MQNVLDKHVKNTDSRQVGHLVQFGHFTETDKSDMTNSGIGMEESLYYKSCLYACACAHDDIGHIADSTFSIS